MQTRPDTARSALDAVMRHAVAIGIAIVALLPAARGFSPTLGWMPLWLVAMPLCAWWALHRFRLPGREGAVDAAPVRMRRRTGAQARRRRPSMLRRRHTQAA